MKESARQLFLSVNSVFSFMYRETPGSGEGDELLPVRDIEEKRVKVVSRRVLLLVVMGTSFVVSNLFWVGRIDKDYFSYYYIGRGVAEGKNMYRDFFENKGPVSYLFFAILAKVFGERYDLALIAGSTLLDGLGSYLILLLVDKWTEGKAFGGGRKKYWEAVGMVVVYKSFSMGQYMGGIYTESVGMPLVLASMWLLERGRPVRSGAVFAAAVLARQTLVFFGLAMAARMVVAKCDSVRIGRWLAGGVGAGLAMAWYVGARGDWGYMVENMVETSWSYATAVSSYYWINLAWRLAVEPRLLYILVFVFWVWVARVSVFKQNTTRLWFAALLASSLLATMVGGVFYFHHFLQMALVVAMAYAMRFKEGVRGMISGYMLLVAGLMVIASYVVYSTTGRGRVDALGYKIPKVAELANKKYMTVVPYYPKFYLDYGIDAPDAYFFPWWISEYLGLKNREKHIERHVGAVEGKETAFAMVYGNEFERGITEGYLKDVGRKLGLVKVNQYAFREVKVDVYENRK